MYSLTCTYKLIVLKFNLFLAHQILYELVMAAWQHWWRRLERSCWEMASSCARVESLGGVVLPVSPPQMRVVLLINCCHEFTVLFSFLSLASSNDVSKQTALQAIAASLSHPTRPCPDVSQWVQCEEGSNRWSAGQQWSRCMGGGSFFCRTSSWHSLNLRWSRATSACGLGSVFLCKGDNSHSSFSIDVGLHYEAECQQQHSSHSVLLEGTAQPSTIGRHHLG